MRCEIHCANFVRSVDLNCACVPLAKTAQVLFLRSFLVLFLRPLIVQKVQAADSTRGECTTDEMSQVIGRRGAVSVCVAGAIDVRIVHSINILFSLFCRDRSSIGVICARWPRASCGDDERRMFLIAHNESPGRRAAIYEADWHFDSPGRGPAVSASAADSICARNDCQIAVVKNLSPVTNRQLRNYVSKYAQAHSIAIRSPRLGAHVNVERQKLRT